MLPPSYQISRETLGLSAFSVVTILVLAFIIKLVRLRQEFRRLSHSNLAALPHSMVLGSIPSFASVVAQNPPDAHPHSIATLLWRKFKLGPFAYLDTWPISGERHIFIADPRVADQVTVTKSFKKSASTGKMLRHLVGAHGMIVLEGQEWKNARSLFNPGFAVNHLTTLIPSIVDDTLIFCKKLSKYAESGKPFQIEADAAALTIDIIGHVVLDHDLNAQTSDNPFVNDFMNAVSWTPAVPGINPFANMNPVMPIMHWYYERKMNSYLMKTLDDRFQARGQSSTTSTKKRGKPAIDLALDQYEAEQEALGNSTTGEIDMEFKRFAVDQMKTFLLGGYDTTSSTISYIFYMLYYHPEALAKLRQEFDVVLGPNVDATPNLLKTQPALINKMVYAAAIIKETLRLYPAASSSRQGESTDVVVDGNSYSTDEALVWIVNHVIHQREDLFPSPDEFIPERFLPAPDNWQDIPRGAWRPFERGPRACIGQELAMMETKIIMALTLREFDILDASKDWDAKMGRQKPGDLLGGTRGMFGYRSYQTLVVTSKPVDGMPVIARRRVIV